jgi:hypothetical protein
MARILRMAAVGSALFTLLLLSACSSQQDNQEVKATSSEQPGSEQPRSAKAQAGRTLYTAYNLWYENPERMYCVNYCKGSLLPAGSKVSGVGVVRKAFKKRQGIEFKTVEDGVTRVIFFNPEFHPGLTIEQFRDRLFTPETLEELTKGLTEEEIAHVRKGEVAVDMSKKAVVLSRGYPPEHETPSVRANRWTYWVSRFNKSVVHFSDGGRVSAIEE